MEILAQIERGLEFYKKLKELERRPEVQELLREVVAPAVGGLHALVIAAQKHEGLRK